MDCKFTKKKKQTNKTTTTKTQTGSGVVAHACNPSILGGPGRQVALGWEFEIRLGNIARPQFYKTTVINQTWGCTPVVPATWKAEVGGSHKPRKIAVSYDCIIALQPV